MSVDVLRLVPRWAQRREIAALLSVSERTVGRHPENAYPRSERATAPTPPPSPSAAPD